MPSKSASRMLRKSSPPIEPRRDEAPTTATVFGEKNGASEAATATWSRSSTASRYCVGRRRSASRTSDVAALEPPRDGEAGVLEDAEHRRVVAACTSATNVAIPCGRGGLGQLLEEARADPLALERVGDGERDLRRAGSRRRT